MPDQDRQQADEGLPRTETDLQPDPMLRTRRGGSVKVWAWAAGLFIIAVVIAVFYGLNS